MRGCPACLAPNPPGVACCRACGAALEEQGFSETIPVQQAATLAAPVAATAAAPTPQPLVRSNPTPRIVAETSAAGADPLPDALVGTRLADRYEVTRKIGEGGMGAVYEARHLLIGKRVAIKVLLDKYAQKPEVVARLQQEARLASSIGHEHIVDITDFGETDAGLTFVVMEYLEGESLAALLAREGPLSPPRAVSIVRQVASALGAAHDKGIVHRDVKPENVFIVRRGDRDFVKVVDFGISKAMRPPDESEGASASPRLTQTGMVLGTPLYMSPEQARGEDVLDHRVDIYAVGVILYECLTGEVPFRGNNYLSIISQVISTEPRRPSEVRPDLGISPALEAVVLRAMAKDRAARYQTMAELDADLARLESGAEVAAMSLSGPRSSRVGRGTRSNARSRLFVWGVAVAGVVAAVALLVPRFLPERAPSAAPATPAAPVPPAPPAPAPEPQPAPPPAPTIQLVTVHVTSDPPGAEVWWESLKKGVTPVDISFPRADDKVELVLKLKGYEDARVPFFPLKDDQLSVTLIKKRPGTRPPRRGKRPTVPAPTQSPTPPPKPTDPGSGEIKPNPYDR